MTTYTRSDQPVRVSRGRSGSFPMHWQTPAGQPIDITGFAITAAFDWRGVRRPLTITRGNQAAGDFMVSWAASVVGDLPLGRIAVLRVLVTDATGAANDVVIPVVGEET